MAPAKSASTRALGFFKGMSYPLRGFRFLLRHRRVVPYALLPFLIHAVLLLIALVLGFFYIDDVYAWIGPKGSAASAELSGWRVALATLQSGVLKALAGLASFLLVAVGGLGSAFLLAAAVAGPFNEQLSEVVEEESLGHPPPEQPLSLRTLSRDAARATFSAVQRLTLFLLLYVPLLILSLIPGLNLLGVPGTALYSAFFLSLNFLDPALERQKYTLRAKIRFGFDHLGPWMGFGASLFLLMLVPVLNLMIAPFLIVGGTLLWLDLKEA